MQFLYIAYSINASEISEEKVLEEYYEVRKEEARYWLEKTDPPKDDPEEIDQEDYEDWIDFEKEGGRDPKVSMYLETTGYFLQEDDAVRCVREDIVEFFSYGAVVQVPVNKPFPAPQKVRLFQWKKGQTEEISCHRDRVTEAIFLRLK